MTKHEFIVVRMNESEFEHSNPSLDRFRSLVYAFYSGGVVREITEPPRFVASKMVYLAANYKNEEYLADLFNADKKKELGEIGNELAGYTRVAGFMCVEWGEKDCKGQVMLEPGLLMKWDGWPDGNMGYVGAFTANPLLSRVAKLELQRKLHDDLYKLALEKKFVDEIYTILAPNVIRFVLDSGLLIEKIADAEINLESAQVATHIISHPGYWESGPQLYKFKVSK